MERRSVQALAKVNLALHVGAPQADGYHPVDTLCVFAAAGDVLSITGAAKDFSLTISGPQGQGLEAGAGNLVLKAAGLFAKATECEPVAFHLHKAVPAASGIGGGTSNGVAALMLLNEQAARPLSPSGLMHLSRGLGADGPVCLAPLLYAGSSFRARGIGFEVTPGPSLPPLHLVLANPNVSVPTGPVFRAFDASPFPAPFELPALPLYLTVRTAAEFVAMSRNDLAPPARGLRAEIDPLEAAMAAAPGCVAARMSGSGATVFGLFSSASAAKRAARRLRVSGAWTSVAPLHRGADR